MRWNQGSILVVGVPVQLVLPWQHGGPAAAANRRAFRADYRVACARMYCDEQNCKTTSTARRRIGASGGATRATSDVSRIVFVNRLSNPCP